MDKWKRFWNQDGDSVSGDSTSPQATEEQGFASQILDSTTLSWGTRIKGFLICFILGFVLSILGTAFFAIPIKGPIIFAVLYTTGNVLSMSSTCFLMDPWKQLKKMFNETRVAATIGVFFFMFLTLIAALKWHKKLLALVFCICQFLAMTWYSISYIPYARDAVKKTLNSCF